MVCFRIDICDADCRQGIDECPRPSIIPEGNSDGRVFEHVECVQEVAGMQFALWDQIALEIPQHFPVATLVRALSEKLWPTGEKRLREKEKGYNERHAGDNAREPVVPLPACRLAQISAPLREMWLVGAKRCGFGMEDTPMTAKCAPFVTKTV